LATYDTVIISTQCRCGRCPPDFHKVCLPGSIPGSATFIAGGPVLIRAS
jgi:hypothetical protein